MGYEYRLYIKPKLNKLEDYCLPTLRNTNWEQIQTSFIGIQGIGIKEKSTPLDSSWPQIADLTLEGNGSVYILCHTNEGTTFINHFIEVLKETGHQVKVDDDI
jgi:hypothetical protein